MTANYFDEQLKTATPWTEEMVAKALEENPNRSDADTLQSRIGERMVFYVLEFGPNEDGRIDMSIKKLWESEIEGFLSTHEFTDYASNLPRFREVLTLAA